MRYLALSLGFALAVTAASQSSNDPLRAGLEALQAGDAHAALGVLAPARDRAPEDGRLRLALAETYRILGRTDEAEDEIAATAELAADAPALLRGISVYFEHAGEPAEAAKFEAGYARAFPDDITGFGRAAGFYLEAGDPRRAVEFSRSGLERQEMAALYDILGKAHADLGQDGPAAEAFRNAIRLKPYEEDYRYNLAYLDLRAERFEQALASFDEAQQIFDKSARIALGRGTALYGLRRFDAAVDAFLKASALAPGAPQPHYFLGRMIEYAGDRVGDILVRQEAFAELQPDNYLAPFLVAQATLAGLPPAGDEEAFAAAEKRLRRSLELRGDFWEAHFELGQLLERQKRYEEARAPLESAVALNPQSSKPHYRLARVYQRLGESEKAAAARAEHARLTEIERQQIDSGAAPAALEEPLK